MKTQMSLSERRRSACWFAADSMPPPGVNRRLLDVSDRNEVLLWNAGGGVLTRW